MSSSLGTTAKPPAPPKAFDSEPARTTWGRERPAERFERVTGAERAVDRDPVGVVHVQVTTERLEGGQHRSHVDQAAHRADAVDKHDRRPTGGRDLADRCGQRCGIGHVEASRRPDLLEHAADHLDGGVRRLLDEERDAGVGHGIAGQGAGAEQRQQAQMDVADRGEGGHLRAAVHLGEEVLQLAEVGRPSPVARRGEVEPEAAHRLCRRRDQIGVRLQTEVGARDELHGLAAVFQLDPLAVARGDDMPGQALLEGPIERVRGLADAGRDPVGRSPRAYLL